MSWTAFFGSTNAALALVACVCVSNYGFLMGKQNDDTHLCEICETVFLLQDADLTDVDKVCLKMF